MIRTSSNRVSFALVVVIIIMFLSQRGVNGLRNSFRWTRTIGRSVSVLFSSTQVGNLSKLESLRQEMIHEGIDSLIIPTDDPHLDEYIPSHYARRQYLTEFTGSAGTAVVTSTSAALFTDGRYFQQAELELPREWTLMRSGLEGVPTIEQYLTTHVPDRGVVGIDPWVHSMETVKTFSTALSTKCIGVKFLNRNLVDVVWNAERPNLPSKPLRLHDLQYAGQSMTDKLQQIREQMSKSGASALVVTALDEIMWLLNIRGDDIPCNPVALCYALVLNGIYP
jgi:Xaa-Pro aminopeptidase